MRKRAQLASAVLLIATAALILASIFTGIKKGGITGYIVYPPTSVCYENNYSCIDLNGDGYVTVEDEEIFAQVLNKTITKESDPEVIMRADFDNNGSVDNAVDFQQCFVYFRDQAIDRRGGKVNCHPPEDNLTGRTNLSDCLNGCADLNGDGDVDNDDYDILKSILADDGLYNESYYPMADLTGDNVVDWEDKFCFTAYIGKIITCNIPTHVKHTQNCPDLTDNAGTGNDGFVNNYDLALFNQYKANNTLKADFNGDNKVDDFDMIIFMEYYGNVVDCDIYHAPWHIGGINQNNSDTTYFDYVPVGGSNYVSYYFTTSREGQLAKLRIYVNYSNSSIPAKDIFVSLHPDNGSGAPNMSVVIDSTIIPKFILNYSHWETAYFRVPPLLENNTKYHIVMRVPNSSSLTYSLIVNSYDYPGGVTQISPDEGINWANATKDMIFETFTTTACGDINRDGICNEEDEDIINQIPDGLNSSGVGDYNETYDINDDHVINDIDYDLVDDARGEEDYLEKPEVDINNSYAAGNIGFGGNQFLAQSFEATSSKISNIALYLAANSISKRDITLEIFNDFNGSPGDSSKGSTKISGFKNQTFRWYNFTFDNTVDLTIGTKYFILVSATETSIANAYKWSNGTVYSDGKASKSTISGNWTNITNSDFAFITYGGDSKWNDSYDVNNDSVIDDDDLILISEFIGSYDGTLWTPLVDFNAIFGVFEKLLDKILGFDAYKDKVLVCGFSWPVSDGNGRCDEDENFSSADCPSCNHDGFCAVSEDFTSCEDCAFWKALPLFDNFNGATTPFYNFTTLTELEAVEDLILEILPYGRITWFGPVNVTEVDFDSFVNIEHNNVSVNTTGLSDEFNSTAVITFYNLSSIYPNIIVNGNDCDEDMCTLIGYINSTYSTPNHTTYDLTFSVEGFSWYSTEDLGPDVSKFNGTDTTDFNINNLDDIANVSNLTLEMPDYGKIRFLENINATKKDFSANIGMNQSVITINITGLPDLLNKSAELSFYNINFTYPIILEDNVRCRENCSFVSYQNGIFTVDLTINSNYSVEEAAPDVSKFNGTDTTDFSINNLDPSGQDIENVSSMTLEKANDGKIVFLNLINATKGEYSENVNIRLNGGTIGGGWVEVNSSAEPELNTSARIYLYNLSLYEPVIRVGVTPYLTDCIPPECNIESYEGYPFVEGVKKCDNNCTLIFNVTHFTKYYAMENSTGPQPINGPIPDATGKLIIKENSVHTINLSYYFYDINNDSMDLIYGVSLDPTLNNISAYIINYTAYINASAYSAPNVGWIRFNASDGNITSWHNNITLIIKPNAPPQLVTFPAQIWNEDTNKTINLNTYFFDPDGDLLTFQSECVGTSLICNGLLVKNISIIINQTTGQTVLSPTPNFNGIRSVRFKATDGQYPVTSANVQLKVNSVNDVPYLEEGDIDSNFKNGEFLDIVLIEDTTKRLCLPDYISDIEDNDWELNYSTNSTPINFNVNFSNGNVTFKPRGNWSGYESFVIKIRDSDGNVSYTNQFTIYITPQNDPIYRTNKTFNFTWYEDDNVQDSLSEYYEDVDGDVVYYAYPQNGSITVDIDYLTGEINFTPDPNWFGKQEINLSATDLVYTLWNSTNLTVLNINDQPYLKSLIPNQTWPEDHNITINLTDYFGDYDIEVDPSADNLTYNYTFFSGTIFNVSINQTTGKTILTPDPDWYGESTIYFKVTDIENTTAFSNVIVLNVTPVNDQPYVQEKNLFVYPNTNLSEGIHVIDPDDYEFTYFLLSNYTNMNISEFGELEWTPVTNISGNYTVNITVCDSSGASNNCTNTTFKIFVFNASLIIDSWIDGIWFNGTYGELNTTYSMIAESIINISNITDSVVGFCNIFNSIIGYDSELVWSDVFNSTTIDSEIEFSNIKNSNLIPARVSNATISNSTMIYAEIINCTVEDSYLEWAFCENGIIDPSSVINSTTVNSTIVDCNLSKVYSVESYCTNSTLSNTNITDANITNNKIYSGTIIMQNGSLYNATADGSKQLKDLINYAPKAVINVSNTTVYTGDVIIFNASATTDPNIPGELNDSITFLWEFGDGTNSTNNITNHSYSTTGTINALMTVTDKFGLSDYEVEEIIVNSRSVPRNRGGGGGGGSTARSIQVIPIELSTLAATYVMNYRDRLEFSYQGIQHSLELAGIYSDKVLVIINSPGARVLLPYDQTFKVDINEDSILDIELRAERISSSKISLIVRLIGAAPSVPAVPEGPSCFDGIRNQNETDTDCGGPDCKKCSDQKDCLNNSDCISGRCTVGICTSCSDKIQNQGETGIDCGGPCAPCQQEALPPPTLQTPAFARVPQRVESTDYTWLYITIAVVVLIGAAGAGAYYWFEVESQKIKFPKTSKVEVGKSIEDKAKAKLIDYITETLGKGYNEKQVKERLGEIGWPDYMVNEAFKELKR